MRILLVSDSYPPLIGGATRATRLLGQELAARGHTVAVATIAQRGAPVHEQDGEVDVHRLPAATYRLRRLSDDRTRVIPAPFPDPELALRLRRLLGSVQPDVVHAYGWIAYSCTLALAGRKVPLVLSARDYGNVCALRTLYRHDRQCEGPAPLKCLRCARREYGSAKAVLAVGGVGAGKRLLRRQTGALHSVSSYVEGVMGRDLLDLGRVPHAVVPDFREVEEEAADVPPEWEERLPPEPFILYVGALRRVKGVHLLLAAYETLADPPPLVLIGPAAPDEPERHPPGVTVVRSAPYGLVLRAWDRSLFGVAPSLWAEPLGNVVHEGMSRGRAVIGTQPGGHTDMIVPGETGLLVPAGDGRALADALRLLIADDGLRRRMGEAARARTERFTAEQVVPRLETVYRSLVAAGAEHGDGRGARSVRRTRAGSSATGRRKGSGAG